MEEEAMVEHPDRVSWYAVLIAEWTGHVPQVAVMAEIGLVVACIGAYVSQAGVEHPQETVSYATDVEQALEGLTNTVYAALEADRQLVQGLVAEVVPVHGYV